MLPTFPYPLLMSCDKAAAYNVVDKNDEIVVPSILSQTTNDGCYIFAISVDNSRDILIYENHTTYNVVNRILYTVKDGDCKYNGTTRTSYNHNNIVKNSDVCAAGEIVINHEKSEILVNNKSGHYMPDEQSIDHVVSLLNVIFGEKVNITVNILDNPVAIEFKKKVRTYG